MTILGLRTFCILREGGVTGGPLVPVPPVMVPSTMPNISSGCTFENFEARSGEKIFLGGTKVFKVASLFTVFEVHFHKTFVSH